VTSFIICCSHLHHPFCHFSVSFIFRTFFEIWPLFIRKICSYHLVLLFPNSCFLVFVLTTYL
jgi:hypothetical protein